jgi:hypothetical protein
MKSFSEAVAEKIGNYVYRLIDPRNGETFYVGKGKGNRVFDHVKCALQPSDEEDDVSEKIDRIREIRNAGLEVMHVIHRHDIPDLAIFEVEAALIDAYSGLSNINTGHGSNAKGPMSAQELADKYDLQAIDEPPAEKLILINVNRAENRHDKLSVLRQTQVAWRVSDKVKEADYVLAVIRGVVVGAYVADDWLTATHKNFPTLIAEGKDMPTRKGFKGQFAPDHVWEKFVGDRGKRIAIDTMKHIQNPIRYWNIK